MTTSRWKTHREIKERWLIEGMFQLETPAHFGNGDVSILTDMPVARDALTGKALLTGASIAGVLRSYLHLLDPNKANQLFGTVAGTSSLESAVIVNDALVEADTQEFELREGVSLDPATRTAEEGKLFDFELLCAGAQFNLCFELNLTGAEADLRRDLAIALHGLESGAIGLGKRKTRGLGQGRIISWTVRHYEVTQPNDLVAWLNDDRSRTKTAPSIAGLLGVDEQEVKRAISPAFWLQAKFRLDSSLLIRSGYGQANAPDRVHLHSKRKGKNDKVEDVPILSGTSLAGALRARALRIANTLAVNEAKAKQLVNSMFGPRPDQGEKCELAASRVRVRESVIYQGRDNLVQNRVKIDRFTGGAYPTALFNQQPVFGLPETRLLIELDLRQGYDQQELDKKAEVGLLLLLLKDLWTGDLPLGGQSSVGRGRLHGVWAKVSLGETHWTLTEQDGNLTVDGANKQILEECVAALGRRIQ